MRETHAHLCFSQPMLRNCRLSSHGITLLGRGWGRTQPTPSPSSRSHPRASSRSQPPASHHRSGRRPCYPGVSSFWNLPGRGAPFPSEETQSTPDSLLDCVPRPFPFWSLGPGSLQCRSGWEPSRRSRMCQSWAVVPVAAPGLEGAAGPPAQDGGSRGH